MITEKIEQKYLRQKDLAIRYGVSAALIYQMVKTKKLPPPMTINGVKVWPIELIESIDNARNSKYLENLDGTWKQCLK